MVGVVLFGDCRLSTVLDVATGITLLLIIITIAGMWYDRNYTREAYQQF